MQKQYVRDLQEKDSVASVFLATDKVVAADKNGKPFMSLNLNDATGSINAKLWEKVDEYAQQFRSGDFVEVKGHVQLYQNRKQVVVHELRVASDDHVQLKDYVATGQVDPELLFTELLTLVRTMKDAHIQKLCEDVLNDPQFKVKFLNSPAAKTIHHAYRGGLIEHIVSICHLLEAVAKQYPELNRDLLIFGGIFHDIGKVWELEVANQISYSDSGRLVGHMGIACELIDQKAQRIMGFPSELRDILKHIVLSHHGKLEYGSPKLPMLPEAVVVAMIDELDSRMNTILTFMHEEVKSGERWTRFHPQLERYFYLDVLRKRLSET